MTNFPPVADNGDPHVEGNNTWIYQDGAWLKQSPQVSTDNVALFDPTNPADILTAYPQTLPEVPSLMASQYDVNRWFVDALTHLDTQFEDGGFIAGISVGEDAPDDPVNGTLWFDSSPEALTLFLYYNPDPDKAGIWIPAAPPVSAIEEINELLGSLGEDVDALELRIYDLNTVGLNAPDPAQDGYIWKNTNPEENRAFIYSGTYPGGSWELLSQVTKISDTSPANPEEGDLWYEPITSKSLSVYAGGQWIQLTVGADGLERIEDIEELNATQDGRLDVLENKVDQLESGPDGTPGGAAATIAYVDAQDDLKVNKSGDTITGVLSISSEGNANDDGVRLYMKDNAGDTNLTMFPSGVVTGKNVIRVNRDSGDAFQVRPANGGTVKWKVDFTGTTYSPKLILTGGADVTKFDRVIDVSAGQPGRLLFNGNTSLTWQNASVKIGRDATVDSAYAVKLDLQNNLIDNVSEIKMTHQGGTAKKFSITGELADGTISEDWFYSYKNAAGTPDAMNYNGKMDNNANLVNKKYVDDAVGAVSTDEFVQKSGDTLTGSLTFNSATLGANGMVNFNKAGNNDVQYKGTWIIGFQGNDTPLIKLNAPLDLNNNKITNLAAPTADKDAVNRKSLEGAKITTTSSGNAKSGGFYYSSGRLFYKI